MLLNFLSIAFSYLVFSYLAMTFGLMLIAFSINLLLIFNLVLIKVMGNIDSGVEGELAGYSPLSCTWGGAQPPLAR